MGGAACIIGIGADALTLAPMPVSAGAGPSAELLGLAEGPPPPFDGASMGDKMVEGAVGNGAGDGVLMLAPVLGIADAGTGVVIPGVGAMLAWLMDDAIAGLEGPGPGPLPSRMPAGEATGARLGGAAGVRGLEAGGMRGAAGCKASSSRLSIFLQAPGLAHSLWSWTGCIPIRVKSSSV